MDQQSGPGAAAGRPTATGSRRRGWIAAAIVSILAVAAAAVIVVLVWRSDGDSGTAPPGTTGTAAPTTPQATTESPTTTPTTTSPPAATFRFQPLWPFAGEAEVREWQRAYREGGHQPWHLDAGLTARQFAQDYLGFTDIDRITGTQVSGDQAWVDVGYRTPDGKDSTAAVIHLAKIGSGADAPWEIVGTRDSTLSLTKPPYGSTVTSPMTVGGRITGVDENLRVRVWRLNAGLVGEAPGVPAGGQDSPWSTSVRFDAPAGSVVTVAVSTGGHVAEVERFAITGVRVGR